jgi:hypothetical protein
MRKLVNKIIKKIFRMDIEALMSLKNNFQNQKFQLVKGKPSARLGKVFEVMDIGAGRGGYYAEFNDGVKVPIDILTSDYMMINGDQHPLTPAEVQSINIDYIPPVGAVNQTEISPDLHIPEDLKLEIAANAPAPQISAPAPQVSAPAQRVSAPVATTTDLFGMFSLEETALNITVKVQLPNKSLLKAMYQNSQNQSDFIDKLSSHINNSVSADSIKESLWKMLDPEKKKQLHDKSSKD